MTKRIAVMAGLSMSFLGLAACSTYDTYGYGADYGYGPAYGSSYSVGVSYYDGFYDNFYGPVHGGYWGPDDYFYYQLRVGGPYVRDAHRHFRRDHFHGGYAFRYPDRRGDHRGPPQQAWGGRDSRGGWDRNDNRNDNRADNRNGGWQGDRGRDGDRDRNWRADNDRGGEPRGSREQQRAGTWQGYRDGRDTAGQPPRPEQGLAGAPQRSWQGGGEQRRSWQGGAQSSEGRGRDQAGGRSGGGGRSRDGGGRGNGGRGNGGGDRGRRG
jgi:uncharacterized membrane protein YgcG